MVAKPIGPQKTRTNFFVTINRSLHSQEICWRLHGRPAQGRAGGKTRPHANHTFMVKTIVSLTYVSPPSVDTWGVL